MRVVIDVQNFAVAAVEWTSSMRTLQAVKHDTPFGVGLNNSKPEYKPQTELEAILLFQTVPIK